MGYPISVQVFEGNTQDTKTVTAQLQKLKTNFVIEQIVLVGDRGMIKSASIAEMDELKWYYITAITKPQIAAMIEKNVFQLELFTDKLIEIEHEGIRYVLHKNPIRANEINQGLLQKIASIEKLVAKKNEYLTQHRRASEAVAIKDINKKLMKLKLSFCIEIKSKNRAIWIEKDENKINKNALLNGCYVIKSNLQKELSTAQNLHDRYKDLAMVEIAFRTMKQSFEEIRPIFVRKEKRTRGHVFVCMLAYLVIKYVWETCKELGLNQTMLFESLDQIQYIQYNIKNTDVKTLPKILSEQQTKILNALKIKLPTYM